MTNNDGQARQMRKWSDTKVFPAFCHRRKSFLRGLTFSFLNSPTYFSIIRAQRFSTFDNLIISALRTISAPSLFFLVFLFLFFFFFFFSGKNQRAAKHNGQFRTVCNRSLERDKKRIPLFHNWKADTIDNRACGEFNLSPATFNYYTASRGNPAIV